MMKPLIFTFIVFLTLSCSNSNNNQESNGETLDKTVSEQSPEKLEVVNAIQGYWQSESYLSAIEKSKSVYANRNYSTSVFGFQLSKKSLLEDEPMLEGITAHEAGYSAPLVFNKSKNVFENDLKKDLKYRFFKEPFEIRLKDNDHIELKFTKSNKREVYRKVGSIENELRRIIFKGKYIDSLSNKTMEFGEEGEVTGIDGKNFYELLFDFGDGLNFDVVFLYKEKEDYPSQETYHYIIHKDTILLYPVTGELPEIIIDEKPKYKLIKQ